ncbi:hypothetical protein TWF730_000059 [Orbilia blumenaviensis]|uniref:Uncharacterized protein n=1 Tax=Orbilia blumenaviensis TaxID=1796055 RepID=A0AAV9VMH1_9PEZI
MWSKLVVFTVIGLSGLVTARYLPSAQKENSQTHLFKRQMENNPFAPKPIVIPQDLNIRLTNDEEENAGDEGGNQGEGPRTPRFSDDGSQRGDGVDDGGEEDILEPPSFSGIGLVNALDRVNLGPLENGPNIIAPYAKVEETIPSEQVGGLENPFNPNVEPSAGKPEYEYEYASFTFDDEKKEDQVETTSPDQSPRNLLAEKTKPRCSDVKPPISVPPQYRPPDQPKYNAFGQRMGLILNEWEWYEDGEREVFPYWGVIQEGHEVAEEPIYLDDDTCSEAQNSANNLDWSSGASPYQINEYIKSLMMGNSEGQSVRSDEDEFFDAQAPTEEQERIIQADLQEQLQAAAAKNQEGGINQDGAPAREVEEVEEVEEFVAESPNNLPAGGSASSGGGSMVGEFVKPQLNDIENFRPSSLVELNKAADTNPEGAVEGQSMKMQEPSPRLPIDLTKQTNIDPKYIEKITSQGNVNNNRPRRQKIQPDEERKVDAQTSDVKLKQIFDPRSVPGWVDDMLKSPEQARPERSKSPLRRFGSFVASLPEKGVTTIVNKIRGRGRQAPATITNIDAPSSLDTSANVESVTQSLDQPVLNKAVQEPVVSYDSQKLPQDIGISTTGWGKLGHDVYDIPAINFGGDEEVDEKEIMKSYYRRRLRK